MRLVNFFVDSCHCWGFDCHALPSALALQELAEGKLKRNWMSDLLHRFVNRDEFDFIRIITAGKDLPVLICLSLILIREANWMCFNLGNVIE